ncbi:MAG TPA: radical SAM protein [bacterium]|nr:radical SAM protein [bacterium]HPN29774.1 radical SAM protein [bacterium]
MKKVLLFMLPWADIRWPYLGLGYIASALTKNDIPSKVFDLNLILFNQFDNKTRELWQEWNRPLFYLGSKGNQKLKNIFEPVIKKSLKKFFSENPQVSICGFSVCDTNLFLSLFTAQIIKEIYPDKKIIFGGPSFFNTLSLKKLIEQSKQFVDGFIIGEGETVFAQVVKYFFEKQSLPENISGFIKSGINNQLFSNAEWIKDINTINHPTYDEFEFELYPQKRFSLLMGRGCIYSCKICNDSVRWGKYRFRNEDNIIEEIEYLKNRYNVTDYYFNDSLINANLEILKNFCEKVIEKKWDLRFDGLARFRKGMDNDLFVLMKKAGFWRLEFGLESGSSKTLDKINKKLDLNAAAQILKSAKNNGIWTAVNLIVGLPGETDEDFQETINFLRINADNINCVESLHTCLLLPGSKIRENPESFGIYKYDEYDVNIWTDGITDFKERENRLKKLLSELQKLGISTGYDLSKKNLGKSMNLIEKIKNYLFS